MVSFRLPAMLVASLLLCACGNPGSPLPPSLLLPEPVTDLHAERTGNIVSLRWTMPRRTTDRLLLKGDQRVVICRAVDKAPCKELGQRLLQPGAAAAAEDALPPELCAGAPHLLRYEVRLENRSRRSAGPSNPAFAAGGAAPPAIAQAKATVDEKGIEIAWQVPSVPAEETAGAEHLLVRLLRERVLAAGEQGDGGKQRTAAGVPQPMQQTLEVREGAGWQPDHTVDTDALLNRQYRYSLQLVRQDELDGHLLETRGLPAEAGVVTARDTFAPAVPTSLAAVADAEGGSIDLSWTAGEEADLAGYVVYRRQDGASGPPERVSGKDLLLTPNWSDRHAQRGVRYRYSVSAVDASGNESARSADASEALPQ